MKEITGNNYSWIDIIDTTSPVVHSFVLEYFVVTILMFTAVLILVKYFKIILRFKLWLIKRELDKKNNSRLLAKKLLCLFSLEKNTGSVSGYFKQSNESNINNCRTILLQTCYGKKPQKEDQLKTILSNISKWL